MLSEPRLYQIAEICYNPEWPKTPWYITRTGTVAGQGGITLGTETFSFETIQAACSFLSTVIHKDMDVIKDAIKDKESKESLTSATK